MKYYENFISKLYLSNKLYMKLVKFLSFEIKKILYQHINYNILTQLFFKFVSLY